MDTCYGGCSFPGEENMVDMFARVFLQSMIVMGAQERIESVQIYQTPDGQLNVDYYDGMKKIEPYAVMPRQAAIDSLSVQDTKDSASSPVSVDEKKEVYRKLVVDRKIAPVITVTNYFRREYDEYSSDFFSQAINSLKSLAETNDMETLEDRHLVGKINDRYFSAIARSVRHEDVDLILPLPKRISKKRNYIVPLAEDLGKRLGGKLINSTALYISREIQPQKGLWDVNSRISNIYGAMNVDSDAVRGKIILLIDDIVSSGTSVIEAARVLYASGAKEVRIFVYAYSVKWSQLQLETFVPIDRMISDGPTRAVSSSPIVVSEAENAQYEFLDFTDFQAGEEIDDLQRFKNLQESRANSLFLKHKIFPQSHPATQYLMSLLAPLIRDTKARVYLYQETKVSGFATPTGRIFVSTGAAKKLMTTRESAQALLMHELLHIEEGHTYQRYTRKPTRWKNISLTHYFELEADIAMMTKADRRGVNPIGAIQLSENSDKAAKKEKDDFYDEHDRTYEQRRRKAKLQQKLGGKDVPLPERLSQKKRKIIDETYDLDLTHGTPKQRGWNLRELTRFLHFKNLKDERHPIDWKNLEIDKLQYSMSEEVSVEGLSSEEFLSALAFRHKNRRGYKKLIKAYIASQGIQLSPQEQAAVLVIFDSFILGDKNVPDLRDTKGFQLEVVRKIIQNNVFEQIGVYLSPKMLLNIARSTYHESLKELEESSFNNVVANLKSFTDVILAYFSERYPGMAQFQIDLNAFLLAEYLITQQMDGQAEFRIEQREAILKVGTKKQQTKLDVVLFDEEIPLMDKNPRQFSRFVSQLGLGQANMDLFLAEIFYALGIPFFENGIADHVIIETHQREIIDRFLSVLESHLRVILSAQQKLLAHNKSLNLFKNLGFTEIFEGGMYMKTDPLPHSDYLAEEIVPLYDEKVKGVTFVDTRIFLVKVAGPLRRAIAKHFRKIGNLTEDTFRRQILSAILVASNPREFQDALRDAFEKVIYASYLDRGTKLAQSRGVNYVPDIIMVRSLSELRKLALWELYSNPDKESFLERVNKLFEFMFQGDEGYRAKDQTSGKKKIFTIKQATEFVNWLSEIITERDASGIGKPFNFKQADISQLKVLFPDIKRDFLNQAAKLEAPEIFDLAVEVIGRFPLVFEPVGRDYYENRWRRISKKTVKHLQGEASSPIKKPETRKKPMPLRKPGDFEKVLALTLMSQGNISSHTVVSISFNEMIQRSRDFKEAFGYLRKYKFLPRNVFFDAVNTLLTEHVKEPLEFEEVMQWLEDVTIDALSSGDKLFALETLQAGFRIVDHEDRAEFMKKALATNLTDEKFKKYLAHKWWMIFKQSVIEGDVLKRAMTLSYYGELQEDSAKIQRARYEIAQPPSQITFIKELDYAFFNEVYSSLFRLDTLTVYLTLRAIALEGGEAVFKSETKKRELIDHVIEHYVHFDETAEARKLVEQFKSVVAEDLAEEDIFYFLGPSLTAMALQAPENEYSTEKVAEDLYAEFLKNPDEELKKLFGDFFKNPDQFPETAELIKIRLRFYVTGFIPKLDYARDDGGVERELQISETQATPFMAFENAALDKIHQYAAPRSTFSQRISPMELSVEVAKRAGGLAVRLMQLVAIFFKLSPENRRIVAEVFDDVTGQNKLQFYSQLKRLASNNPNFKVVFDKVKEIGKMLGGGSIVTVYSVKDENGRKWAVGNNNPNVVYRAGEMKKFSDQILNGLIRRDPENRYFRALKKLMDKSYQWLMDEVNDPDYIEKNTEYTLKNDHRPESAGRYQNMKGALHEIMIPELIDTKTVEVRWEEQVEGVSLNSLLVEYVTAKSEGDSETAWRLAPIVKSAVATVGQNYIYQLDNRLAHSDVHPGQYIISQAAGQLAVLDRKNLLRLDEADTQEARRVLQQLLKDWNPGDEEGREKTPEGDVVGLISRYFQAAEESSGDRETLEELQEELVKDAEELGVEGVVSDTMWSLLNEDIDIPLPVILILKNLLALHRMSKEAGFKDVGDMFLYDPSSPDSDYDAAHVLKTARRIAPNITREFIVDEMIQQLTGKSVKAIFKNSLVVEKVKKKSRAFLDRMRRSSRKPVSRRIKTSVQEWFERLEANTTISLDDEADRLGLTRDELREILGYAVAEVDGNLNQVVKSDAPVSDTLPKGNEKSASSPVEAKKSVWDTLFSRRDALKTATLLLGVSLLEGRPPNTKVSLDTMPSELPKIKPFDDKEIPAQEFVKVFNLEEFEITGSARYTDIPGLEIYTITVPGEKFASLSPVGSNPLQQLIDKKHTPEDIAKESFEFDLLYHAREDGSRELIAIFSLVSGNVFYLADYYVPYELLRQQGDPRAVNEWRKIAQRAKENQKLIGRYNRKTFDKATFTAFGESPGPYVYMEIDSKTQTPKFTRFSLNIFNKEQSKTLENLEATLFNPDNNNERIILTILPTVYFKPEVDEMGNQRYIRHSSDYQFQDGDHIGDLGTGTGLILLFRWLFTKNRRDEGLNLFYHAADINPIASANAWINLHHIAGIPENALQVTNHDNLISPQGTYAWTDENSDPIPMQVIDANAPAFPSPIGADLDHFIQSGDREGFRELIENSAIINRKQSLEEYHDNYPSGVAFWLNFTSALADPKVFDQIRGEAQAWNQKRIGVETDVVEAIIRFYDIPLSIRVVEEPIRSRIQILFYYITPQTSETAASEESISSIDNTVASDEVRLGSSPIQNPSSASLRTTSNEKLSSSPAKPLVTQDQFSQRVSKQLSKKGKRASLKHNAINAATSYERLYHHVRRAIDDILIIFTLVKPKKSIAELDLWRIVYQALNVSMDGWHDYASNYRYNSLFRVLDRSPTTIQLGTMWNHMTKRTVYEAAARQAGLQNLSLLERVIDDKLRVIDKDGSLTSVRIEAMSPEQQGELRQSLMPYIEKVNRTIWDPALDRTDASLLRKKIRSSVFTIAEIAVTAEISINSLSRMMSGGSSARDSRQIAIEKALRTLQGNPLDSERIKEVDQQKLEARLAAINDIVRKEDRSKETRLLANYILQYPDQADFVLETLEWKPQLLLMRALLVSQFERVMTVVGRLTEADQEILEALYGLKGQGRLTMEALGMRLRGITSAAVRQREGKVIGKLITALTTQRASSPISDKQNRGQSHSDAGSSPVQSNKPGGIDMNPNNLDLQTQGRRFDFKLPLDSIDLQNIHIDGFTPVIINVTPLTNLPLLLGLVDNEETSIPKNANHTPKRDPVNHKEENYLKISSLN